MAKGDARTVLRVFFVEGKEGPQIEIFPIGMSVPDAMWAIGAAQKGISMLSDMIPTGSTNPDKGQNPRRLLDGGSKTS